jgi:hypothetical protein
MPPANRLSTQGRASELASARVAESGRQRAVIPSRLPRRSSRLRAVIPSRSAVRLGESSRLRLGCRAGFGSNHAESSRLRRVTMIPSRLRLDVNPVGCGPWFRQFPAAARVQSDVGRESEPRLGI